MKTPGMVNREHPMQWLAAELDELDRNQLRRRLVTHTGPQASELFVEGVSLVNFASNDYLGLAGDPRLGQAVADACQKEGWGAGASPLICGHGHSHRQLELRLAEFEGTEAALLFSSGYAANAGTIAALVGRGDAVFGDELNHASLIDGCRLSRADVHVYRHGDCSHLEDLLKSSNGQRRRLIVTDTLFSMDGDIAPLVELAALAEEYGCMLLVDEAHATGVFGPHGRGICELLGIEQRVHVRIGTLSKALGSVGGFVAGSQTLVDWLLNRARPYVFSTASPPAGSAASLVALAIVESEPNRREQLLARAAWLRETLVEQGWNVGRSRSQIIPLLLGASEKALRIAARLREQGLWVPAIRPPSVPAGQARLRISLSYAHSQQVVEELARALEDQRSF